MYYWPEPFRRLTFGNKFLCMQCPLNHVSRIVVLCFACDRLMTLKYPDVYTHPLRIWRAAPRTAELNLLSLAHFRILSAIPREAHSWTRAHVVQRAAVSPVNK